MSEHNSLLCGGELYDNLLLILSQLFSHYHTILAINCVYASSWFTHLQHVKLMIKMTILFLFFYCYSTMLQVLQTFQVSLHLKDYITGIGTLIFSSNYSYAKYFSYTLKKQIVTLASIW